MNNVIFMMGRDKNYVPDEPPHIAQIRQRKEEVFKDMKQNGCTINKLNRYGALYRLYNNLHNLQEV